MILFETVGTDPFYESIRKNEHSQSMQFKTFFNQRYRLLQAFLDDDFPQKLTNEFERRLWELLICSHLYKIPSIRLLKAGEYKRKNISSPDFCFLFNGKRYFVEAVCFNGGKYPELNKDIFEVLNIARLLDRNGFKEKFCSSFKEKRDKYFSYQKNMSPDDGYIIAISSGGIRSHNHPRELTCELSCLFGFELALNPNTRKVVYQKRNVLIKENKSEIPIGYLDQKENSFITGVILSQSDNVFFNEIYLPDLMGISVPETEFVYVHNHLANVSLPPGLMNIRNEIKLIDNKLVDPWSFNDDNLSKLVGV